MTDSERSPHDDRRRADCAGCALARGAADRRTFLRDAALTATALLVALGAGPERAAALALRATRAAARLGSELAYPVPPQDGAQVDRDNAVILVRYQGAAYAFALSCPHQNTALKWLEDEQRFQCPKHKSRYQPDGHFISGRATRGMDRHAIRRDGERLLVDLDTLYREDENRAAWEAAVVRV